MLAISLLRMLIFGCGFSARVSSRRQVIQKVPTRYMVAVSSRPRATNTGQRVALTPPEVIDDEIDETVSGADPDVKQQGQHLEKPSSRE